MPCGKPRVWNTQSKNRGWEPSKRRFPPTVLLCSPGLCMPAPQERLRRRGGYQPPPRLAALFKRLRRTQRPQQPGWRLHTGSLSPASGGGLFTAEKSPKRAGGCGPRSPIRPRGVHPKERHRPSRYAPPGCPAPYCPPLPGFARASGIGWPLRLQGFSLRPHELPRNRGWTPHTAVLRANFPSSP